MVWQLRVLPKSLVYLQRLSEITIRERRSVYKKKLVNGLLSIISHDGLKPIPPGSLTSFYNMDFVTSIARSKGHPTLKTISEYAKKEVVKKLEAMRTMRRRKRQRIGEKPINMLLSIMRGFGLIEVVPWRNTFKVTLTHLGEAVRATIKEHDLFRRLKEADKVTIVLFSGLLFPTKARLLYLTMKTPGYHDKSDYYTLIRSKLMHGDLHGYEKLAWEVLEELVVIRGRKADKYASQSELILHVLESIDEYPGFETFKYYANKIKLKYLPTGFAQLLERPLEPPTIRSRMAREVLDKLAENLAEEEKKESIETQLVALYELPIRI